MNVQNQRVNGIVFNAKITVTQTGFLKLRNSRIFSPCQSQVLFKGHLMVRTADLEELDSSNVGRLQDRQMRSSFSNNRWSHLVVPVECVILVPTTWLFVVPTGTIIYYLVRTITWRGGPRSPRINTSLHKECFLLSPGSSWCSWSLHVFVKCPLGFASFIFSSDGNWEEILVACENVFASQDYEIVRIGGFMRLDSLTGEALATMKKCGLCSAGQGSRASRNNRMPAQSIPQILLSWDPLKIQASRNRTQIKYRFPWGVTSGWNGQSENLKIITLYFPLWLGTLPSSALGLEKVGYHQSSHLFNQHLAHPYSPCKAPFIWREKNLLLTPAAVPEIQSSVKMIHPHDFLKVNSLIYYLNTLIFQMKLYISIIISQM